MNQKKYQKGQAYAELFVGFVVLGSFLFGAYHVWRYAEARQLLLSAARFVAWERTVWEPSDNAVEKFALHRSDDSLAKNAVIHQLSTPEIWRKERTGASGAGTPATIAEADRRNMLRPAMRTFISDGNNPNNLLTVSTTSELARGWLVGRDPTFNTTTNLELDRETYRKVVVSLNGLLAPVTMGKFFGYTLPNLQSTKTMSLIANTWAASPPVMRVRTARQLIAMSTGDETSGTKANPLAFFGQDNGGAGLGVGDFVGMAPWWNFLGGMNGLGGQYVVKKIGLDSGGINNLVQSSGDFEWDSNKSAAQNLLVQAQIDQREYFQPNAVSTAFQRHLNVQDKTADAKNKPPRNSVVNGKRKYMAVSMQNPVENYFSESPR